MGASRKLAVVVQLRGKSFRWSTGLTVPVVTQVMPMTTWVPAVLSVYWTIIISALLWAAVTDLP